MWLSVLLPTYNGEAYVADALKSILAQSGSSRLDDVEVIAVDDGSTDGTVDVLRTFQDRLQLTIVGRRRTGNWIETSNHALGRADGEYVCWLHQDDFWRAGRLSTLRRVVEAAPEAPLVVHASDFVDQFGRGVGHWPCALPADGRVLTAAEALRVFAVHDPIAASAALFRRDAVNVVGEPDARLWYYGDWEFWLRLVRLGGTVCCPHALTAFRIHRESQTALRTVDTDDIRDQFHAVYERHLRHCGAAAGLPGMARLAFEVDVCLMRAYHSRWPDFGACLSAAFRAGVRGSLRSFSDSGISERVFARLRALLRSTEQNGSGPAPQGAPGRESRAFT